MLLQHAVVALRSDDIGERETIVENPEPGAQHGFGTRVLGIAARRPGNRQTWSEIAPVVNICLRLIAQSKAERDVGLHSPIIANKRSQIRLMHRQPGLAGVEGELRRSAPRDAKQSLLITLDGAENECAVEVVRRDVVFQIAPQADAVFPDVRAFRRRRIVLQLESILRVVRLAKLRAPVVESSDHFNLGSVAFRQPMARAAEILEARLIDAVAEHGRFRGLYGLIQIAVVIAARGQVERSDTGAINVGLRDGIADLQRIVAVQSIVDARAGASKNLRDFVNTEIRLDAQRLRAQRNGIDDRAVIHRVPLAIEDERRALIDGAAGVAFEFIEQKRGLLRRIGIARVPDIVGVIVIQRPPVAIAARLSENFDAAITKPVILGRKWILVDANFADGIFGGGFRRR